MKGHTNNPNGRPRKAAEDRRKMVSYRLTVSAIEKLKKAAAELKLSQSDLLISIIDDSYLTN